MLNLKILFRCLHPSIFRQVNHPRWFIQLKFADLKLTLLNIATLFHQVLVVNVGLDDGFLVLDDDGDLGDLDDLVNSLQNTQKLNI